MQLEADWFKGETATFDIKVKGKVLVQQGRRITALHIKQLKASKIKLLAVPDDYVIGKVLSENLVDSETGEIFANANDEITEEMLAMIRDKGIKQIRTIFTNEVDRGPYISARVCREPVPEPVLQRRALRSVRSRPHEV
jgi:DNA-directed RNA polymerase subunit beta